MGEIGLYREVSITEPILWKFPKFPEIVGELSMHKQSVPCSIFLFPVLHALLHVHCKCLSIYMYSKHPFQKCTGLI